MPSEYQKWLARNEKPREERMLTKEEKRQNWWDYHRTTVIVFGVVLALAIWFAVDIATSIVKTPDYRIAYIGSQSLPLDTVAALEKEIAEMGIDLSGDGRVKVQIIQYVVAEDSDYYSEVKLMTDITSRTSPFFLCEDPQKIQKIYEVFSYEDGTYPPEELAFTEQLWCAWGECAGLASLELGDYHIDPDYFSEMIGEESGNSQELLSKLYVCRRGLWEGLEEEKAKEYTRMYKLFLYGTENDG